jgi:hypothetical protein
MAEGLLVLFWFAGFITVLQVIVFWKEGREESFQGTYKGTRKEI